jgi:hypothetical protein
MKKSKLVINYDYDFELVGVTSSAKSYKLAWELNRSLSLHLIKQPDLVVGFKNVDKYFGYYAHETQLNRLKLFKNRPNDGETGKYFLIPEFPHFDFIILSQLEEHASKYNLIALIKGIPSVQLASNIPLEGLKSKSNFVF